MAGQGQPNATGVTRPQARGRARVPNRELTRINSMRGNGRGASLPGVLYFDPEATRRAPPLRAKKETLSCTSVGVESLGRGGTASGVSRPAPNSIRGSPPGSGVVPFSSRCCPCLSEHGVHLWSPGWRRLDRWVVKPGGTDPDLYVSEALGADDIRQPCLRD